jgi:hypothetical protein
VRERYRGREPLRKLQVERDHYSPGDHVTDGNNAGDDRASAHVQEGGSDAEQFVARMALRKREIASREDEQVGRVSQLVEIECGERAVSKLKVREQRAVGAEVPVTGDVGDRGTVEGA